MCQSTLQISVRSMRLIVVEEDGFYYLFLVLRAALILGHHKFEGGALSNALFFLYRKTSDFGVEAERSYFFLRFEPGTFIGE